MSIAFKYFCLLWTMSFFAASADAAQERKNFNIIGSSGSSIICAELRFISINSKKSPSDPGLIKILEIIQRNAKDTGKIDTTTFQSALLIGDYVSIHLEYNLKHRSIPWREDFNINNAGVPSKITTNDFNQFYELTYLKMKENLFSQCSAPLKGQKTLPIKWMSPYGETLTQNNTKKHDNPIIWQLAYSPIDIEIKRIDKTWMPDKPKNKLAMEFVNQILSPQPDINNNYGSSNQNLVYFNSVREESGKHRQIQIESKARMKELISKWEHIRLIGQLSLEKKSYIYFSSRNSKQDPEAIHVFQYHIDSDTLKISEGIEPNFETAILSNTAILDAFAKNEK